MTSRMTSQALTVFINCRDRVSCLARLVAWLEKASVKSIVLIDNDSTYPSLLSYYDATPHRVIKLGQNVGHEALWRANILAQTNTTGRYIYTDPDVVPADDCPLNAIQHMNAFLDRHPSIHKVGLGLRLDDLPSHYKFRDEVIKWEKQFWRHPIEKGFFAAEVDTSFALYRGPGKAGPSARTDHPYVARHESWYVNSANLDEEERHYRSRATCTHWASDRLPPVLEAAIRNV